MGYNLSMDWQLHEQDWAVNLLRSHAGGGNLRHAYLFTGPEGVGRKTLAIKFAQALNCMQPPEKGGFCGTCRNCRQIQSLTYPDLSLLLPEEGHKDILIGQVRSLQHTLALTPYAGTYRVALLPDFQQATVQASNALLKTLEEPSDKVVLLLTANAPEALLPTIVSRCEVVRLRPSSIESTQKFLEMNKGFLADQASLFAHLSGGRVGAAIRMAEDPNVLLHRQDYLESLLEILSSQRDERFKLVEQLVKSCDRSRQALNEVLLIWLSFWRDIFLRSTGGALPIINIDYERQIERLSSQLISEHARALIVAHEEAQKQLDAYVNTQLLFENLVLQWPKIDLPIINLNGNFVD